MNNPYKYTQNNFFDTSLIERLVQIANFKPSDTVLDIGAGDGIITRELLKYTKNIISIEIDKNLFSKLKNNIIDPNVVLLNEDFLNIKLPDTPYHVFSNIPFNKTSDIVNKILGSESKLISAYLVIQKEAALKFGGNQLDSKSSLSSIVLGLDYQFEIIYKFKRSDFVPIPNVDIVLLKISKRERPLIEQNMRELFKDFVAYMFNRSVPNIMRSKLITDIQMKRFEKDLGVRKDSKPSDLTLSMYINLFNVIASTDKKDIFVGYYQRILNEQKGIEKVNRTRY